MREVRGSIPRWSIYICCPTDAVGRRVVVQVVGVAERGGAREQRELVQHRRQLALHPPRHRRRHRALLVARERHGHVRHRVLDHLVRLFSVFRGGVGGVGGERGVNNGARGTSYSLLEFVLDDADGGRGEGACRDRERARFLTRRVCVLLRMTHRGGGALEQVRRHRLHGPVQLFVRGRQGLLERIRVEILNLLQTQQRRGKEREKRRAC
jgi:hypothetical protein